MINFYVQCLLIIIFFHLEGVSSTSDQKLKTLYTSLNPTSVSQHLAFYELYPSHPLGQKALQDAWNLLTGKQEKNVCLNGIPLSGPVIQALINIVNKQPNTELVPLTSQELDEIEKLSKRLSHYNLQGHSVWNEKDIWPLPTEEVDLARGLFLSQFGNDSLRIRTYEAMIDLIALQILARLPPKASPELVIKATNQMIFDEMRFRFPPQSLYANHIDVYTFLPSVLDSHRGVCLGVSILYLCLAQRLNLQLEMVTPPGHIYIRHRSKDKMINIETTARGIHLDCEEYLSINNRSLKHRPHKEVIGMAHFNQASVYWQQEQFEQAFLAYQKAEPYLKDDPLLKELMGYTCLLTNRETLGLELIKSIKDHIPDYAVVKSTVAEDYLNGMTDAKSIAILFSRTDENRTALLAKKDSLEKIIHKFPRFRAGLLQLAMTWTQLHRAEKALEKLKELDAFYPHDPEVNYYLAILQAQRLDYPQAWIHLKQAETLTLARAYDCKQLKELRQALVKECPE
ncbi:transglutaminase family protein [Candidatus Protochlamydia sp. R18]|uniref:transglutaminase family protein n=1 Tax=Candidatus Protochlamydia sp. R18 TaxID=1353977 RepID=UPI0009AEC39F|nr:transglutaminase family protein [Candidatus Protochlamydia sp. R18]